MSDDRFAAVGRDITLCYRTHGDPANPPLLLIAGLGLDLTSWPEAMIDALADRGLFVIRFDNRDSGRSTRASAPPPGMLRKVTARPRLDAYDLGDMAQDTTGLLGHLGVARAHLVGMSMGGMIAQTIAARHPERARSLTSIFSTTGHRKVGQPAPSTILRMVTPHARTKKKAITRHRNMMRHIASPGYPLDERAQHAYAAGAWERGDGPTAWQGVARQVGAIQKSGDRTEELRGVTAPSLVIHGDRDLMIAPSGGRATAEAIPGARHVVIAGMGHNFPAALIPRLSELITDHAITGTTT
ncbi:alpha/beta fold hydrolase [Streptomyces sp. NPDC002738]